MQCSLRSALRELGFGSRGTLARIFNLRRQDISVNSAPRRSDRYRESSWYKPNGKRSSILKTGGGRAAYALECSAEKTAENKLQSIEHNLRS